MRTSRVSTLAVVITVVSSCATQQDTVLAGAMDLPGLTIVETVQAPLDVQSAGGSRGVVIHRVHLPPDLMWHALAGAFHELGLEGAGVVDEGRRIFGYPDAVFPRRLKDRRLSGFLDCGQSPGGANADFYRVTGTILAAVRPDQDPDRSLVEVSIEASGRAREVGGQAARCSSNGRLERLITQTASALAVASY